MNTSAPQSSTSSINTQPADDRQALEQSEKKAAEKHPDNFKDEATEDKLVEIGPDMTDSPIKGIDPAEDTSR
jgi:hypothetical protein